VENKHNVTRRCFLATPFFVTLCWWYVECCYSRWWMVLGRIHFSPCHSTSFLSTKYIRLFFS